MNWGYCVQKMLGKRMEDIFVVSRSSDAAKTFFSLQMINADVQNTNRACLYSLVYIIIVNDKNHPEDQKKVYVT